MNQQKYEELLGEIWENQPASIMPKDVFYSICLPVIKEAWCDGYRAGNDDAFES